jgi:peptidoglycan/xylan/chitin deacetylase (PgdA/CDA1 family)
MYHDVESPEGVRGGFPGDGPAVYAVTTDLFHAHLDALGAATRTAPLIAPELTGAEAQREPWMLTFDDGGTSAVAAGAELARRGWRGHFFVVTSLVGTPGFADWGALAALAEQGHAIGSHSHTHPQPISSCSEAQLLDEWAASVELIAERLGRPVTTASVPGGYYSPEVGRAAVAAGIEWLFTSEPVTGLRALDGCTLVGRYAVRRDTTAGQVAAAAAGKHGPWLRQRAAWELRGVAKKVAGRHYRRLRAALLARR